MDCHCLPGRYVNFDRVSNNMASCGGPSHLVIEGVSGAKTGGPCVRVWKDRRHLESGKIAGSQILY
jgi:hypothetical protein